MTFEITSSDKKKLNFFQYVPCFFKKEGLYYHSNKLVLTNTERNFDTSEGNSGVQPPELR